MTLMQLSNLCKVFHRGDEEIFAIRDLSLTITEGEFIAITGASGSGKSTLLYLLGLLDTPTSGQYHLRDKATHLLSDDERAGLRNAFMGFVFQSFHLLPRATALRNVMMPSVYSTAASSSALNEQQQRERAEAALRIVGLQDRMLHVPNQLSGGQRQRVAIARAIVNSPRVLFADEPTGNLDSKSGKEVLALFERLHSEGVTVIMVTHDPSIAERAHRRLVFGDGALIEDRHAS